MSYNLTVANANHFPFWKNYWAHLLKISAEPPWITMDKDLVKYNAINIPNSTMIQFESEEDAAAFVLRWS